MLNVIVAVAGLALARVTPYERADEGDHVEPAEMAPGAKLALVAIAISGATALGAEVVWTRLMALNFGGTTYTFSLILAAFLLGIGLGYPGQPHVVNRFMALRDEDSLRRGRVIALVWAAITYTGMLLAGWCARVLLDSGVSDAETSLIGLTLELFPPVVAGVIVAAILSALMSTAARDSTTDWASA